MKLIKRLFILVLIIGAFFAGVTYYQGRQQYTDAVAQVPVEEKIQQIRKETIERIFGTAKEQHGF